MCKMYAKIIYKKGFEEMQLNSSKWNRYDVNKINGLSTPHAARMVFYFIYACVSILNSMTKSSLSTTAL